MQDNSTLLEQVTSGLKAPSNDSQTEVGQKASKNRSDNQSSQADHVDAINQLFTEFELGYHNQYHKAFPNCETLQLAKQLWLKHLAPFEPRRIVQAGRKAIAESEYLPTIHNMLKYCQPSLADYGLPEARLAYYEACQAPSPKAEYSWSHQAVYYAGKETDWFFLANTAESKALPVFTRNYEMVCQRVFNGEELTIELPKAIPQTVSTPMTNEQKKARLKALREDIGI